MKQLRRSHMLLSVDIGGNNYLDENFRIMMIEKEFKLQAHVAGVWKTLYRFDTQEQFLVDYEVANYYLYTHPSSVLRNSLIAAIPFEDGRYALSNTQFSIYAKDGKIKKVELKSVQEIKDVLINRFQIKLPESPELDFRLASLF